MNNHAASCRCECLSTPHTFGDRLCILLTGAVFVASIFVTLALMPFLFMGWLCFGTEVWGVMDAASHLGRYPDERRCRRVHKGKAWADSPVGCARCRPRVKVADSTGDTFAFGDLGEWPISASRIGPVLVGGER